MSTTTQPPPTTTTSKNEEPNIIQQQKPQQTTIQPQSQSQQQQQQQQQYENQQSISKKIRKAWTHFEINLIKAANACKQPTQSTSTSTSTSTQSQPQEEQIQKCIDYIKSRKELRSVLNDAEAEINDKTSELKAMKLMSKCTGSYYGNYHHSKHGRISSNSNRDSTSNSYSKSTSGDNGLKRKREE